MDDEQDNYEPGWGEAMETAKPQVQFKEGQSTTAIYAVKSHGINPMNWKEVFEDLKGSLTLRVECSQQDRVRGIRNPRFRVLLGTNADWERV